MKKKQDFTKYNINNVSAKIPAKWNLPEIKKELGLSTTALVQFSLAEFLIRRGYQID